MSSIDLDYDLESSDIEYIPVVLRENTFVNSEIESIPDESEININRGDWLDFLDSFLFTNEEESQQDVFSDYIDISENDSVIYDYFEQFPDINFDGYQNAIENFSQDADELYIDRLVDETDYGEMYDNSHLIDN